MMKALLIGKRPPKTEPQCRGIRYRPSQKHCRYGVAPRNFFGTFAEPSPPPAPAFGNRTTGGVTTGPSVTVNLPAELDADELIVIMVGGSRSASATTSCTGGNTWVKMLEINQQNGSSWGFLSVWGRIGIIGDVSTVSFSCGTGNTNMTYICERWTGVGSWSTGLTGIGSTSAGTTLNLNTVTPTVDNSVILSMAGGRTLSTGALASFSWAGGATAAYSTASGRIGFMLNARETVNPTHDSRIHTFTFSNTQGAPVTCVGSVILSPI